jgi:hypothetical protein
MRHREPELVLGMGAQVLTRAHGLAPGIFTKVMTAMNRRWGPEVPASGSQSMRGRNAPESRSHARWTVRERRAAAQLNQEFSPGREPEVLERPEYMYE